jgi:hypothetical protein
VFSLSSSLSSRGDPSEYMTRCSGCHSSPHLFLVGLHCVGFLRFLLLAYAMGVVVV